MLFSELYKKALLKRPLVTKMCTSSKIFGVAEYLKIKVESNLQVPDTKVCQKRLIKAFLFGGFVAAPSLHVWYSLALTKLLPKKNYSSIACKILLDQIIFSPYFLLVTSYSAVLIKNEHFQSVKERFQEEHWRALRANWSFWPVAQLFNFTVVSKHFQILFINVVGIFWQGYLTYLRHAYWNSLRSPILS